MQMPTTESANAKESYLCPDREGSRLPTDIVSPLTGLIGFLQGIIPRFRFASPGAIIFHPLRGFEQVSPQSGRYIVDNMVSFNFGYNVT
jgi:hypothetical protein